MCNSQWPACPRCQQSKSLEGLAVGSCLAGQALELHLSEKHSLLVGPSAVMETFGFCNPQGRLASYSVCTQRKTGRDNQDISQQLN